MPASERHRRAQAARNEARGRKKDPPRYSKTSVDAIKQEVEGELAKLKKSGLKVESWNDAKAMFQAERECYNAGREKLSFATEAGHLLNQAEIDRQLIRFHEIVSGTIKRLPDLFAENAPPVERMAWKQSAERIGKILSNEIADALGAND